MKICEGSAKRSHFVTTCTSQPIVLVHFVTMTSPKESVHFLCTEALLHARRAHYGRSLIRLKSTLRKYRAVILVANACLVGVSCSVCPLLGPANETRCPRPNLIQTCAQCQNLFASNASNTGLGVSSVENFWTSFLSISF